MSRERNQQNQMEHLMSEDWDWQAEYCQQLIWQQQAEEALQRAERGEASLDDVHLLEWVYDTRTASVD